ncbi:MAG: aconitase X catalytic domain-containing protein [Thermoplasmata archaeon]
MSRGICERMYLTKEEEKILRGESGQARQKAMELLVTLGDLANAERLIEVKSAQIAGASYKTISDAGVEFLEEFAKEAKVIENATLNPIGMDRDNWKQMRIRESFAKPQLRILEAYAKMGVKMTCTCTPYFIGNRPAAGEHIAWAESSAVVFANSVLGARTNKEGGPSALAAAILGKTPYSGLHIEENRQPTVLIKVAFEMTPDDYSLLGHSIGGRIGQKIPLITGIAPTEEEHKALGAAMAASGAASIYHFRKEHSECKEFKTIDERISIERIDLEESREKLNTATDEPDIVTIGCPHLSKNELLDIARFLKNREPTRKCDAWFCVSRDIANQCPEEVGILKRFGQVACDTCMVVAPLEDISKTAATDSAKAGVYLPTLCKQKVMFASRKELLGMISR